MPEQGVYLETAENMIWYIIVLMLWLGTYGKDIHKSIQPRSLPEGLKNQSA